MNPRRRLPAYMLNPRGPTPCFCPSCMAMGGPARAELRRRWFASNRRLVLRATRTEDITPAEKRARKQVLDRKYTIARQARVQAARAVRP